MNEVWFVFTTMGDLKEKPDVYEVWGKQDNFFIVTRRKQAII
jgi:hypothetical protein